MRHEESSERPDFAIMKRELKQLFQEHNSYDLNNYIREEEMENGSGSPLEPSGLFYDSDYDEKNRYKDSSDEEAIYQRHYLKDPLDPLSEPNLTRITTTDQKIQNILLNRKDETHPNFLSDIQEVRVVGFDHFKKLLVNDHSSK